MKKAQPGEYDPKAKLIEDVVACPQCSARAMVFADGAVLCFAEAVSFVPEPADTDLFARKQAYRAD